jgi:hypothetical protein
MFCRGIPRVEFGKRSVAVHIFSGYLISEESEEPVVLYVRRGDCVAGAALL